MIDMIIYQRGFQSSAKFLSAVDELMTSLINIRR
jgi:flagellar hook-associated protein 1